jgi:hypothetical protein
MMEKFKENLTEASIIHNDNEIVVEKFDYSTADIESSVFFGDFSSESQSEGGVFQDMKGIFKLVDGKLYEIANFVPPNAIPLPKTSGLLKLAGL